jgi:hypothetical protein
LREPVQELVALAIAGGLGGGEAAGGPEVVSIPGIAGDLVGRRKTEEASVVIPRGLHEWAQLTLECSESHGQNLLYALTVS